jgi:hypothetical protein
MCDDDRLVNTVSLLCCLTIERLKADLAAVEDIKALNDGLEKLHAEKGLDIKIHVDAGSYKAQSASSFAELTRSVCSFWWIRRAICQA